VLANCFTASDPREVAERRGNSINDSMIVDCQNVRFLVFLEGIEQDCGEILCWKCFDS